MVQFVLQKLRNKKWLVASLLIGNILLIAIAAASPMYTKAALQRMLERTMSDQAVETGHYPTTAYVYTSSTSGRDAYLKDVDEIRNLGAKLGVTPMTIIENHYLSGVYMKPELTRRDDRDITTRIGYLLDLENHIEIVSGSLFGETTDGVIDAIVSEKALVNLGLMQGEIVTSTAVLGADGNPIRVRIAGVFRGIDDGSQYWYRAPSQYTDQLFISKAAFETDIDAGELQKAERCLWYYIFDYKQLTVDNCAGIAARSQQMETKYREEHYHSYTDYFSGSVAQYLIEAQKVTATLRILQVPIYVLLFAFIFMVSRQMLEMEAAEISVIKSRGASRGQLIGIYALQSLILAVVSLLVGIPFAMLICQIIGSANAFLEFVSRSSLHLELNGTVLLYALVAALVSMAAMVLPVLRYSKVSIVARKQQGKARKNTKPLWQKLFLDVILLAVSLYGLYTFRGQEEQIIEKVHAGGGLDPLIYLASSLFIIACGLLTMRIIPLVVGVIYRIGRRWWSPSLYASYLWVLRTRSKQGYIVTFLVVTIALGIFNASTARTINSNETDRITYEDGGADIVLKEQWKDNSDLVEDDETGQTKLTYTEPDFARYANLEGVQSATRVLYDDRATATMNGMRRSSTLTLMGIQTREFGETATLKDGLMEEHFYAYLNAISQKSNAILVSSNFREKYGYKLGDTLSYRDSGGNSARGVIYGFVDYWPTFRATATVKDSDGIEREVDNLLIVANLGYLQAQWGITPYQVWLKMDDTAPIYDMIRNDPGLTLTFFRDQNADLVAMKNDPSIQGTNGILTVGFVVALVLCTVGFLIYWILAIRSRSLQFGIFRAMGMSMGEVVLMLLSEQFYVSGLSIAIGVGAGILASKLYVPLVQMAYASASAPLPLAVSLAGSDIVRLLAVVLVVVAVCMVILGMIIRKMKIAQALKLGED